AHPLAGVLSAYGMGLAEQTAMRERSVEQLLDEGGYALAGQVLDELESAARAELVVQGEEPGKLRASRRVLLRYRGTDTALSIAWGSVESLREGFERAYRQRFAFLLPERPLVVESAVVEVLGAPADDALVNASI